MAEQPELDLPPIAPAAPRALTPQRRMGFGGFSRQQILGGLALLALVVWGMWVTRALTAAKTEPIASARLSALVGDYVEAQRFSGSPPERVQAEMRAFMASLDTELQRRSSNGQVVLVGEAVLTRNVPDITDSLKKAVFASGVPVPKRVSIEELQRRHQVSGLQPSLVAPQRMTVPEAVADPMTAQMFPRQESAPARPQQQNSPTLQSPSVTTFGGPDGNPRQ